MRNSLRKSFPVSLRTMLLGAAILLVAGPAIAQSCPSRAIRLIVPFAPGGGADTIARVLVPKWSELEGQRVVVDNRGGAGGNIAVGIAARAEPNGCTLLFGHSAPLVVNPSLYKNLPFDPEKDFAPIMLIGSSQYLLVVHAGVPVKSVRELVALIKESKPGHFTYSSTGVGAAGHLAAELFKTRAQIDITHVPYNGSAASALAVLSGEVNMFIGSVASSMAHVKAGKLKALAVTGPNRSAEAPGVPTMQESGYPGYDVRFWFGVLARSGTPRQTIDRVYGTLTKVLAAPEVQEALKREGLESATATPQEFAAYMKAQKLFWEKVIREANIRID